MKETAEKSAQTSAGPIREPGAKRVVQPKLTVNQPGDRYEQEADQMADQVMRMKSGDMHLVQRMPLSPVLPPLQRKESSEGDAEGTFAPPIVSEVLSAGGGRPMDTSTSEFMESRFGQDFSQVRIHTDTRAAESAHAIQARAYTSGKDVVFGAGEYQPGSESGKLLLAHELVHTQQQGNGAQRKIQRKDDPKKNGFEIDFKVEANKYLDSKEWQTEKKKIASGYVESNNIQEIGKALAAACMVKSKVFSRAFSEIGLEIIDQLIYSSRGDVSLIAAAWLTDEQLRHAPPQILVAMHTAIENGMGYIGAAHYSTQFPRLLDAIPLAYINKPDALTPEEINTARTFIAKTADPVKQGQLYKKLQEKPVYLTQRDNTTSSKSKSGELVQIGDVMCNLTSLAMCLSYLGISNPHPGMQYEDALEKIRVDHKFGARTTQEGWGKVAEFLGVTQKKFAENVKKGKDWYIKNVQLAHLDKGHAVMMSITGHIVRVQEVTAGGLVVDDPFGQSRLDAGTKRGWTKTNQSPDTNKKKNAKEGEANEGENNVWAWDKVEAHNMLWIAYFARNSETFKFPVTSPKK